ncbi:uncharacterized protein BCR38DRAFT_165448 [Pseudomassariella vexata]|uniref:Uncharacterized protein n=1 Tax=Pseudomassariella vexata TaxID=1141098 RepID=A0A1Y2E8G0_9PEZI|nr:uncharacterized protein BCR38DRAFT_165448 [Pseudomassariella vexata]ORY67829.1 hypothetical protein BCR38DRAFT_165448 [Pseudomassariella vexata]
MAIYPFRLRLLQLRGHARAYTPVHHHHHYQGLTPMVMEKCIRSKETLATSPSAFEMGKGKGNFTCNGADKVHKVNHMDKVNDMARQLISNPQFLARMRYHVAQPMRLLNDGEQGLEYFLMHDCTGLSTQPDPVAQVFWLHASSASGSGGVEVKSSRPRNADSDKDGTVPLPQLVCPLGLLFAQRYGRMRLDDTEQWTGYEVVLDAHHPDAPLWLLYNGNCDMGNDADNQAPPVPEVDMFDATDCLIKSLLPSLVAVGKRRKHDEQAMMNTTTTRPPGAICILKSSLVFITPSSSTTPPYSVAQVAKLALQSHRTLQPQLEPLGDYQLPLLDNDAPYHVHVPLTTANLPSPIDPPNTCPPIAHHSLPRPSSSDVCPRPCRARLHR